MVPDRYNISANCFSSSAYFEEENFAPNSIHLEFIFYVFNPKSHCAWLGWTLMKVPLYPQSDASINSQLLIPPGGSSWKTPKWGVLGKPHDCHCWIPSRPHCCLVMSSSRIIAPAPGCHSDLPASSAVASRSKKAAKVVTTQPCHCLPGL